ncbi:MAG: four helix bundle protein [Phototrophicaceae bacterium]|jgi:four helix bundle protein
MGHIQKFEDLIAWQKARILTKAIYTATNQGAFAKDFGLRDQIQRAAVSVMSNIAEGYERDGATEFHRFLVIAKASCAEVRSQLYIALDVGYLTQREFDTLMSQATETALVIGGLLHSVKRKLP